MMSFNLREVYKTSALLTYIIAAIIFYFIFGFQGILSIYMYNVSQYPALFSVGALYFYLTRKYMVPFIFFKRLKCPKCDQQYMEYIFGSSVRLDILNLKSCQHCKYQGKFEM